MNHIKKVTYLIYTTLLLAISINAQAQVSVIVSVAPPIMETIAPPARYVDCYTVPSSFYNGIWINAHRVCNYNDVPGHDVWISGYWGCTRYTPFGGNCLHWSWFPSHWMRTGYVEYGVSYYHPQYYHPYHHYDHYYDYHHGYHWHDSYHYHDHYHHH